MRYVLGFDGGGTKTDCVLMDENRTVLAQAHGGPSNPMRVGFGGALASVCESARQAMQNANIPPTEVLALCAGLAGTGHEEAARKMKRLLQTEFPDSAIHICTDLELTIEATGDGPAIVLIAGTGSAAVGRDDDGRIARVGGRGPLLGDEGSAYDIGRRAAILALREFDRSGTNSDLGKKMLQELGIANWQEFQSHAQSVPDEVFPRIFPVVASAAELGDSTAQELLQTAALELASLVSDLVEQLQFKNRRFLLVKSGGMIGPSPYLDKELDARLRMVAPQAKFAALLLSPAEAAARLALRSLAQPVEEGK